MGSEFSFLQHYEVDTEKVTGYPHDQQQLANVLVVCLHRRTKGRRQEETNSAVLSCSR